MKRDETSYEDKKAWKLEVKKTIGQLSNKLEQEGNI